jgi:multidrug efflux pump subunit AcrA (membrane-fusion protein)
MTMTPMTHAGTVGAVALAGLALTGCSSHPRTPAESQPAIAVQTARVSRVDLAETFDAGGVVQARATAAIAARILAPIREVRVAAGDRVRAGQVLVVLDGAALSAQARSAHAASIAAERAIDALTSDRQAADAALGLARATYDRIASLHSRRSATAQELDEATARLRAAEANASAAAARRQAAEADVDRARAAGAAADATADFAVLTAPFGGVVTERMADPGAMAAPGTPLLRLEDTRGFELHVRVDESRIGRVAPGSAVAVALDAPDGEPAPVRGTVSEVARAADAGARAFLVKIALPDLAGARSGTFGRARFTAGVRRALQVPPGALVRRGQVTSVFVVENGTARVRLVDVSGAEVLAGLSDGETVILSPPPTVTDGSRVATEGR